MMPAQRPGRSRQDYGTPVDFLEAVALRWGIPDLDLAASPSNTVAERFYTEADDSLSKPWDGRRMWLNPPFARIEPWAWNCAKWAARGDAHPDARLLFLVPASVGANWFADFVIGKALVLALSPRLTFVGCDQPYPKDCILAVYGETPGFDVWRWPTPPSSSGVSRGSSALDAGSCFCATPPRERRFGRRARDWTTTDDPD